MNIIIGDIRNKAKTPKFSFRSEEIPKRSLNQIDVEKFQVQFH